jgi:hypothetical protein
MKRGKPITTWVPQQIFDKIWAEKERRRISYEDFASVSAVVSELIEQAISAKEAKKEVTE